MRTRLSRRQWSALERGLPNAWRKDRSSFRVYLSWPDRFVKGGPPAATRANESRQAPALAGLARCVGSILVAEVVRRSLTRGMARRKNEMEKSVDYEATINISETASASVLF